MRRPRAPAARAPPTSGQTCASRSSPHLVHVVHLRFRKLGLCVLRLIPVLPVQQRLPVAIDLQLGNLDLGWVNAHRDGGTCETPRAAQAKPTTDHPRGAHTQRKRVDKHTRAHTRSATVTLDARRVHGDQKPRCAAARITDAAPPSTSTPCNKPMSPRSRLPCRHPSASSIS